jgi:hypothetical protein
MAVNAADEYEEFKRESLIKLLNDIIASLEDNTKMDSYALGTVAPGWPKTKDGVTCEPDLIQEGD